MPLSIIVPAHNEEAVLARCLTALTSGAAPGELQVIVVANGCTDHTADVARGFGLPVCVIETDVANKSHALNLGDVSAHHFPRFYIDADVILSLRDLRALSAVLQQGKVHAVAPRFRMNTVGSSWAVRAFYDINQRLPSSREGIGGSGVYGLSKEGRARFNAFPALTADDGYVRVQFKPEERETVATSFSMVVAPKTLQELITIKTRSHFGSLELRERCPELWANRGPGNGAALKRLCFRPWLWTKLAAYGYVKLAARAGARRKLRVGDHAWGRANSSRIAPASEPVHVELDRTARNQGSKKILAVSSGGGHWVQLLRCVPAFEQHDVAFITVNAAYRSQVEGHRFYAVNDATRWNKVALIVLAFRLLLIVLRENPDVIVSTGAAPGYLTLRIGKWLGRRTVWIDSIANVEELSMSGKRIGRHADLWLTQWPHLAKPGGPRFVGAVL